MKRTKIMSIGLALAAVATGVVAQKYEKCPETADVCLREMVDHLAHRGWIGVEMDTHEGGAVITKVVEGSPAEAAGIRVGDDWIGVDQVRFASQDEKEAWGYVKKAIVPGNRLTVVVRRSGEVVELVVAPTQIPRHILAQWVGQHMLEAHGHAAAQTADAEPGSKEDPSDP